MHQEYAIHDAADARLAAGAGSSSLAELKSRISAWACNPRQMQPCTYSKAMTPYAGRDAEILPAAPSVAASRRHTDWPTEAIC